MQILISTRNVKVIYRNYERQYRVKRKYRKANTRENTSMTIGNRNEIEETDLILNTSTLRFRQKEI